MSDQKSADHRRTSRERKRITGQRKILLDVILEGKWSSCKEIYYMASKRIQLSACDCLQNGRRIRGIGILSRGYRYSYPVEDKIS